MKRLRDYQTLCIEAVRSAMRRKLRRVLVEVATGLGKGTIIAFLAKFALDKGKRVLIIVNRDILVNQLLAELKELKVFAMREQSQERASLTAGVVVASVQSLQGNWLNRFDQNFFDFAITDEVHFSAGKTFKAILDRFRSAFHLGVTATAERHDKAGLWDGFEEIVFRMPLKTYTDEDGVIIKGGIDEGWLCDFEFVDLERPVTLDEKLQKKANYSENDEVFDATKYMPQIAHDMLAAFDGEKSLVFAPNCGRSKAMAQRFCDLGAEARHVDSTYMSAKETEEALEWFSGSINGILVNAQLLKYGYNQKDIRNIGLARPIGSTVDFKQILGRGSRTITPVDLYDTPEERRLAILASDKPNCRVVSVFWENGSHDLASASCLITANKDEQRELNKQRKAGDKFDLKHLEGKLVAKRMADIVEEERKHAEQIANSQAKKQRGKLWIGDILKQFNPAHKPASDKFVQYVRRMGADIPPGQYSAYQIMRIKERIEKQKAL